LNCKTRGNNCAASGKMLTENLIGFTFSCVVQS
jgi:hypothetical protein